MRAYAHVQVLGQSAVDRQADCSLAGEPNLAPSHVHVCLIGVCKILYLSLALEFYFSAKKIQIIFE